MSPVYLAIWSFITIYFYCELGEQVNSAFERFDKVLYSCDWYLFPMELQRMLPTFIAYVQQPVIIRGYGNTLCTRFAFNNVDNFWFWKMNKFIFIIISRFRRSMGGFHTSWCFDKWLAQINRGITPKWESNQSYFKIIHIHIKNLKNKWKLYVDLSLQDNHERNIISIVELCAATGFFHLIQNHSSKLLAHN